MHMKKFLTVCTVCLGLLTTSCGISRQATGNCNRTQTEVVLAQKNYKVVGTVTGESSQNYWFGIGGLSKKSLGESAMSDMYKNANLTGSQAIINVNVSYRNKFILIYTGAKAIATGTVIQFVDDMNESISSTIGGINKPSNLNEGDTMLSESSLEKESFTLTYLKKRKSSSEWDMVKEEHLHTTFANVTSLAEKWNNKSSKKYDYKCNIKKSK